jgi:hypothetical protein
MAIETKLSRLKAAWSAGDKMGALRIAAAFPRLGDEKRAITQAWAALQNPGFYRQIGKDPEDLISDGMQAMALKYEL